MLCNTYAVRKDCFSVLRHSFTNPELSSPVGQGEGTNAEQPQVRGSAPFALRGDIFRVDLSLILRRGEEWMENTLLKVPHTAPDSGVAAEKEMVDAL